MIPTHSLFNSENRFPKNELLSLKIFNFSVCDFRNLLQHIKWLEEQFGNELNDCKQIARAVHKRSECNFLDPLQFFSKLLGTPFNTFLNCTAIPIVRIAPPFNFESYCMVLGTFYVSSGTPIFLNYP